MNDYQRIRWAALEGKLIDLVLDEADPDNWSGDGKTLRDLSQLERGDRYWCKKNAAAALVLLVRVTTMLEAKAEADKPDAGGHAASMDRAIARAESAATKMLERVGSAGARSHGAG